MSDGIVFYEGKSQLTNDNIVGVATKNTKNTKTGDLIQTWIMPADLNPLEAYKSGADESVCGNCKLRAGACYVNLGQAPNAVYKAWKRGIYPLNIDYKFFENKKIRFGSWGDTAAIPIDIWHKILAVSIACVAYTHQWNKAQFQWYKEFCQASVDSVEEYKQAKSLGWRTFRVKSAHDSVLPSEAVCPASIEGGYKSTCAKCLLCAGTIKVARDIIINSHGLPHKIKKFEQLDMRMRNKESEALV